ncbi:hypothetical protein GQ457_14G018290 [Hibiscus cannabinus]
MMLETFWSYNVELLFAASFDSKMGCLCSVFDVKKKGKPIREVRTRYWKLREGENRLSGLLEGISHHSLSFEAYALFPTMQIASFGKARRQGGSSITFVQVRFLWLCIDTSSVVSVPNSNTGIWVSVLLEGYRYPFEVHVGIDTPL